MPYDRILKANMMPSGGCLLHFLVNSQIFSMIKISVENRLKKRNVHRFTITVRRMYILCKPCPAACMTLSFRCGSGRRLTELARIVQRPAHIIRYFLSFSYREVRLMPSILAARARLPSASSRVLRSSCFSFSVRNLPISGRISPASCSSPARNRRFPFSIQICGSHRIPAASSLSCLLSF
mgnify:CR=1 FL=1